MSETSGKPAEKTVRRTRSSEKTSESGSMSETPAEGTLTLTKKPRASRSQVKLEDSGSRVESTMEPVGKPAATARKRASKAEKSEAVTAPAAEGETPIIKRTRITRKTVSAEVASSAEISSAEPVAKTLRKLRTKAVAAESLVSPAPIEIAVPDSLQTPVIKTVSRKARPIRILPKPAQEFETPRFANADRPARNADDKPFSTPRTQQRRSTNDARNPRDSRFNRTEKIKSAVYFDEEGDVNGNVAPERLARKNPSEQRSPRGQLPAAVAGAGAATLNRPRRAPRNPQHGRRHEERRVRNPSDAPPLFSSGSHEGQSGQYSPPPRTPRTPRSPLGNRSNRALRENRNPRESSTRSEFNLPENINAVSAEGTDNYGNIPPMQPPALGQPDFSPHGKKKPLRVVPVRRGELPTQQPDIEEEKPERLHKLLAEAGIGSRREMEEWIIAGRVSVNAMPAHVGQLVQSNDRIRVNGKLIDLKKASSRQARVLLYHKPEGQIVSRDDPQQRETVFEALPRLRSGRWLAVGRLDYNTSGLLLFTTSGELANRLTHPSANLVREYAVRILGDISEEAKHQLLDGIELEDGPARFTTLEEAGGEGANRWLNVTIYEGRNREVRRMFESVGVTISRLMRVRYGPFILPPYLKRGQVRELELSEVETLLHQFGINQRSWGGGASARTMRGPRDAARTKPLRGAIKPSFEGDIGANRDGNRKARPSSVATSKGKVAPKGGRSSNLLGSGRRRRNKSPRI